MTDFSPLLVVCGVVCIWPLFLAAVGFWVGRSGIKLRSPIARSADTPSKREPVGYARRP